VGCRGVRIFIQCYLPLSRRRSTPDAEHWVLMRELEIAIAADRAGIKYIWASEHHFLDEYSHLSASDVVLGYLAHATDEPTSVRASSTRCPSQPPGQSGRAGGHA